MDRASTTRDSVAWSEFRDRGDDKLPALLFAGLTDGEDDPGAPAGRTAAPTTWPSPGTGGKEGFRDLRRRGGGGRGGRGLSLRVHRTKSGRISRTWRQRLRIEGRLTSVGLGPYPEITLAEARRKALDNSRAVVHGGDPRERGVPTFAEAAERTIELHRDGWKAGSPLPEQWESTFRLHAASLLDKPVDRTTSADVLACLVPIWTSKPGAARKARHRISAVFRWCIGKNLRPDNPVDRAVVGLPRANGNAPRHYRALPHGEVAAAIRAIRRVKYIHPSAVLCVEMIALTAVRAGEARGARWDEIDLEAGVWTIPASRMKGPGASSPFR